MAQRSVAAQSRIIGGDDYVKFLQSSLKGSTRDLSLTVVPASVPEGSERNLDVTVSVALTEVTIGRGRFDFKGTCQGKSVSGYYEVSPGSTKRGGRLNFA
jgi:hypothetical protein